ncbi:hypothetical protein [Bdellovibrio sp. HCB337]|uniref:hypothetical protein n=1 Tax=Bdellovibrio sp. HCB337 TaxID=3394358 RepID=UPI0039A49762
MKMISTSLLAALMFVGLQANADGKCTAKDPGMSAFCSNLNEQGCGFSAGKCSWEKEDEKVIRVVVEQREKKCVAKEGYEAHEGFCNNQSKMHCKVHSLCTWE